MSGLFDEFIANESQILQWHVAVLQSAPDAIRSEQHNWHSVILPQTLKIWHCHVKNDVRVPSFCCKLKCGITWKPSSSFVSWFNFAVFFQASKNPPDPADLKHCCCMLSEEKGVKSELFVELPSHKQCRCCQRFIAWEAQKTVAQFKSCQVKCECERVFLQDVEAGTCFFMPPRVCQKQKSTVEMRPWF